MIDDENLDGLLHYCKKLDENGELAERIIPSVLIELITRLRQAQKDAARYRWLRECNWNLSVACVVVDPKKSVKPGCDCPSGDRLDELVDAHI